MPQSNGKALFLTTRRQQRTARPNSKHPNTTGNNTQHGPAPGGRESTAQRARTQAHQHSNTQKAPRKGRRPETRHKERQRPDQRQHSRTTQEHAQGQTEHNKPKAADEARRDPSTATKQTTQHRTKRHTTARQSTQRHSAKEASTRTQRDRATANSKTHHSGPPHRRKQPRAPRKGKEQRKKKTAENTAALDSTTQQKQHNKTKHNSAPDSKVEEPSPTQTRHTAPGKTHNTSQTAAPHNTMHDDAQHRALQPAGGGGQRNQHPPPLKKNGGRHMERGRGEAYNTTRHPTTGQNTKQQTPPHTKARRNSTTRPGATGQHTTAHKGNGRPQAPQGKTRGQSPWRGHQKQHGEGKQPEPARHKRTRATRQATTHGEQAQPGSTE